MASIGIEDFSKSFALAILLERIIPWKNKKMETGIQGIKQSVNAQLKIG